MTALRRFLFLLAALLSLTPHIHAREDKAITAAREEFRYDPSAMTMLTNAGFHNDRYAFSCDGRYIFTASDNVLCVYDRITLRLIKPFVCRDLRYMIPSPTDPSLIILGFPAQDSRDLLDTAVAILDWKTGEITGHLSEDWISGNKNAVQPQIDLMAWVDGLGYVPSRDIETFSGWGYNTTGQSGAWFCRNDSMIVVDSNDAPYLWDITRARSANNGLDPREILASRPPRPHLSFTRKTPPGWDKLRDIKPLPDGRRYLLTEGYSIFVVDPARYEEIGFDAIELAVKLPGRDNFESIFSCSAIPGNRYVVGTSYGRVLMYDANTRKWQESKDPVSGTVISSIDINSDSTRVITADNGASFAIWDTHDFSPIVQVVSYHPYGRIANSLDNYYTYEYMSMSIDNLVHVSKDNRVFSLDQLDYRYNRPDIIARRLGADPKYVDLLLKARDKRLRRDGIDESSLADGFHTPEIEITNIDGILEIVQQEDVELKIAVSDTLVPLRRLLLTVNGVPVHGENGLLLSGHSQSLTVKVPLAGRTNRVAAVVFNAHGIQSNKAEVVVESSIRSSESKLWVVAMGVSDYSDPLYSLRYGAKDANDIAALAKDKMNVFSEVKTLTLTDRSFTSASLDEIGRFLSHASTHDTVLLFFAGHGVLDSKLDYYLAPHDMDFDNPALKGVSLERLTGLLDGVKALSRYIIIDACHSGGVDKEAYLADNTTSISGLDKSGGLVFRNLGGLRERSREMSMISSLANDMFTDISLRAGATLITSAQGDEVAVESDTWQNGLFTHMLKEGLDKDPVTGKYPMDKVSDVSLEELVEYAAKRVSEVSGNAQNPSLKSKQHHNLIITK